MDEQIFGLVDDERFGRRSKKSKGIKAPGSGEIYIQPVSVALLVVLQSIPASTGLPQDLEHVRNLTHYFFQLCVSFVFLYILIT